MPCHRMGNGVVCTADPIIKYGGFIFEWHHYFGPSEYELLVDEDMGEYYEPTNRDSTDAFYDAAVEWHQLPEEEQIKYRVVG